MQNRVDGVVRGVRLCSGLSGNIRCHKVSPCSTRAKGSMYPRPARLRLRAAKPPEGSAPRPLFSAASRSRSIGIAGTRSRLRSARKTPRSHCVPPPCRMTMRRGLVAPGSLRSRLRRSGSCSTLFYIKARPESILTRRGLCRTTPLNTALFRAGAFQLRSGPPQTVPGLPAFRLRGRFRGWRARSRFPFVPAGSPGMRLPS